MAIVVVHFLYASVAEGEFSHPVDSAANSPCRQTQVSIAGRHVEAVRAEVVAAVNNISAHVNRLVLSTFNIYFDIYIFALVYSKIYFKLATFSILEGLLCLIFVTKSKSLPQILAIVV
jgi:hypothetical protein